MDPVDREFAITVWPLIAEQVQAVVDALGGIDALREMVAQAEAAQQQRREQFPAVEPGEPCHCLCSVQGHDQRTCSGLAETMHLVHDERVWLGTREIPMCTSCSSALDELTEWRRFGTGRPSTPD